ncbi:MAG: energy transducer TonB [Bacteroidota bacterium]
MPKEKKEKNFIKKPVYPGGNKAMKDFIRNNMKYPKEAAENRIEGTVRVKYTINHLGRVIEAKVISKLGHGCDEEAVRLVKLLRFETEKPRGVKVKFHKDINIYFKLPKKSKPQIAVEYTPTEKPKEKPKKEGGNSYSITIEY